SAAPPVMITHASAAPPVMITHASAAPPVMTIHVNAAHDVTTILAAAMTMMMIKNLDPFRSRFLPIQTIGSSFELTNGACHHSLLFLHKFYH
ncbi:hypothetical protein, partial [Pseudoneobacillus sp. C159]